MRNQLSLFFLIILLGATVPAQAQLRSNMQAREARAQLYGQSGPAFSLNRLFSPEHFRMSHSYEMSIGSFGRYASSLGMYTNTMQFQFNDKLAGRVDLAYAFSPFGAVGIQGAGNDRGRFLLRNAEVAYRPSKNVHLHLQVRQSPYGAWMSPYGRMRPYGYGYGYGGFGYDDAFYGRGLYMRPGTSRIDDLFWNDHAR